MPKRFMLSSTTQRIISAFIAMCLAMASVFASIESYAATHTHAHTTPHAHGTEGSHGSHGSHSHNATERAPASSPHYDAARNSERDVDCGFGECVTCHVLCHATALLPTESVNAALPAIQSTFAEIAAPRATDPPGRIERPNW